MLFFEVNDRSENRKVFYINATNIAYVENGQFAYFENGQSNWSKNPYGCFISFNCAAEEMERIFIEGVTAEEIMGLINSAQRNKK
jgi:hypothetical protein